MAFDNLSKARSFDLLNEVWNSVVNENYVSKEFWKDII